MTTAAIVALLVSVLCYWLSGARSAVYLAHFCAYVPFITLDARPGGLVGVDGLDGGNVRFKLGVRLVCSLILLACLARQRRSLQTIFRVRHLPVILLFAWSVLWIHRSQDSWIALARLGELIVFFLSGIALVLEAAQYKTARTIARWHALAIGSLPLMALYFWQSSPQLASHVDASGLMRLGHKFLNANSLGFASTVLCLWAASELARPSPRRSLAKPALCDRLLPLAFLAIGATVLFASRSRTAFAALVVGLAIVHWPRRGFSYAQVVGLSAALLALAFAHVGLTEWILRGESATSLSSGTGRTGLWSALLQEQVPKASMGGAGYLMLSENGGFQHVGRVWNNAHNTYIGALVAVGIPGLLCVLAIVWMPLQAARRQALGAWANGDAEERAGWTLIYALTAAVAIASITGFGVAGYPNPLMHFHYGLYAYVLAAEPIGKSIAIGPRKKDSVASDAPIRSQAA